MDQKRYETGLANRRDVLGSEYVDRALQNVGDFDRQFQNLVTEMAWGECWGDSTLPRRERSILNLGMLAALGRMHEFELHFRGALRNGLTQEDLRAVLIQVAVYCGIPAGVECFRIAKKVLEEGRPR
jgi:4-carboxymuconolactone decarboxylase